MRENTEQPVNRKIDREMQGEVQAARYEAPEALDQRVEYLDHEWDMERVLELNASGLALAGLFLAATGSKRWLLMPTVVLGFLVQHALQGWCPPVPVLRRLGFRTQREIEAEKYALKSLQKLGSRD